MVLFTSKFSKLLHHDICSFQSVNLFFFCQTLGYAQLFQVFWRAALLQLPYGCLGNAIRWAKSSRHRPTWAAMPRQAPLENAQNGLQQPKQVIFCSFPFPVIFLVSGGFQVFFREISTFIAIFLVSAELRTLSFSFFFVKSQRSFIDFCHLTIFFPQQHGQKEDCRRVPVEGSDALHCRHHRRCPASLYQDWSSQPQCLRRTYRNRKSRFADPIFCQSGQNLRDR